MPGPTYIPVRPLVPASSQEVSRAITYVQAWEAAACPTQFADIVTEAKLSYGRPEDINDAIADDSIPVEDIDSLGETDFEAIIDNVGKTKETPIGSHAAAVAEGAKDFSCEMKPRPDLEQAVESPAALADNIVAVDAAVQQFLGQTGDSNNTGYIEPEINGDHKINHMQDKNISIKGGVDNDTIKIDSDNATLDKAMSRPRKVITCDCNEPTESQDPSDVLAKTLMKYLGMADEEDFTLLTVNDKERIGGQLKTLLEKVADGAIVPLMNSLLSEGEVEKLAILKSICVESPNNVIDHVKKEEPADSIHDDTYVVNSSIPGQSARTVERENDSDSDSSALISSDEDNL